MTRKTVATRPGQPPKHIDLTQEEIAQRTQEEAQALSEAKVDVVRARRNEKIKEGVTINNYRISTDATDLVYLLALKLHADDNPSFKTKYKTLDGYLELNAQQIKRLYTEAFTHLHKIYKSESAILDKIDTLDDATKAKEEFDKEFNKE